MWSKPAEPRGGATNNKTASVKKASGNWKRRPNNVDAADDNKKSDPKPGKGRRNRNKNKDTKPEPTKTKQQKDKDEETVVLRCDANKRSTDVTLKRYSDSFVIDDNDKGKMAEDAPTAQPLTRALSGFFVVDQSRKRFSDLFRHSTEKSVDLSAARDAATDKENVVANSYKKGDVPPDAQTKTKTAVQQPAAATDSYIKRVKSRIYKSKSDDAAKIELDKYKKKSKKSLDMNGRIPEEEATVGGSNTQKYLTPFSLVRQTTNLERISRPFGSKRSVETVEKPVLAKAKSSSAINLNLLRTRRAKIMEQAAAVYSAASSVCRDEFDYIAFGSLQSVNKLTNSATNLTKVPSWLHINHRGEGRDGGRSGTERKSDAFCDDSFRESDHDASQNHHHQQDETSADKKDHQSQESSVSLPATGGSSRRKLASNINRSESVKEQSEKRKQRRNISDPSHNTSGSLDLDRQQPGWQSNAAAVAAAAAGGSGSSSNSNISCNGKLSESPSNSVDVVQQATVHPTDSDSDIEAEADPLNWQDLVSEEELSKLDPSEKKRQDVINELFHTEFSHVQILKVLYKLFYKKLQETQVLKPDELGLIFPNIKELLDIHSEVEREMRRIRKQDPLVRQIGDMLVDTFGGPQGELLQRAAATFCERQQLALEFIKKRRERDSKFDGLLAESEKKRQCRRLQLQGIVPAEMQRLVRYPLLLERLIKSVETCDRDTGEYGDELTKLQQAHNFSKEILNHVNEAAKAAHNRHRLEEIQKHLDTSSFRTSDHGIVNEFRNIDLTRYQLILEGSMQLRRPNKAPVPVHVLLLEEMVVILHRENEKFLLKFFQSGSPAQPLPLSPIIKMNTLLVRNNAVCKNALFLVNTSTNNSQMYDLVTEDETKRETWYKHFSEATEAYNRREGKIGRIGHTPSDPGVSEDDLDILLDLPANSDDSEQKETPTKEPALPQNVSDVKTTDQPKPKSDTETPDSVTGGSAVQSATKVNVEDWPLIQPSQVRVSVPPVCTAEPILTPLEQIRQKDEIVRQALADKEDLVADLLFIPREHFQHIADLASSAAADSAASGTGDSDITDRLLASIFQVDILQKAVNDAFNLTESEVANRQSQPAIPTIPASFVRDVASSLSSQLTNLLSNFKQVEEERDRLRQEVAALKEKLQDCPSEEEFCEANSEVQSCNKE